MICENMARVVFIIYFVIFLVHSVQNEDIYFQSELRKYLVLIEIDL